MSSETPPIYDTKPLYDFTGLDKILTTSRSLKQLAYNEEINRSTAENFAKTVAGSAVEQKIENQKIDAKYLNKAEEKIEEYGLNIEEEFDNFNFAPKDAARSNEFYKSIENTEKLEIENIDAVVGIDLSGAPYAQATARKWDKDLYFCKKSRTDSETDWLLEKPSEDEDILLIDDTAETYKTIQTLKEELGSPKTAIRQEVKTMRNARPQKNIIL